jgi:hypothetical protein
VEAAAFRPPKRQPAKRALALGSPAKNAPGSDQPAIPHPKRRLLQILRNRPIFHPSKSPKAIRWKRRPSGRRNTSQPKRALALGPPAKMLRPRINQFGMLYMTPHIIITQARPNRISRNIFKVPLEVTRILNPMLRISSLPHIANRPESEGKPALDELNCFLKRHLPPESEADERDRASAPNRGDNIAASLGPIEERPSTAQRCAPPEK